MDDIWRDALLFHKWANQKVLDACANLSGEQLRLTAPGTYGTIADTLQHLLSAERGYVRRLTNAERIRPRRVRSRALRRLKESSRRATMR
jgi:uncharacterized damage-inducible protein DinB